MRIDERQWEELIVIESEYGFVGRCDQLMMSVFGEVEQIGDTGFVVGESGDGIERTCVVAE